MQNFNILIIVVLIISLLNVNLVLGDGAKCNKDSKCLQSLPCCSNNGNCGIGYNFCKSNGCFGEGNYRDSKCLPPPPCKNQIIKMNASRIAVDGKYNGDYINYDFIAHSDYEVRDGELILKMSKPSKGANVRSTRYINYGKITAVMKTARGPGIVSAFNTMSDVGDEIDFEWVGSKLDHVETNWFYQGGKSYPHSELHDTPNKVNTYDEYHSYTIDWNEQRIIWLVDGKVIREVKNNGDGFPSTPSPYEFGLWDAGSLGGSVAEWAGGPTNWQSEDVKRDGYFSVRIKEFQIECYGPQTSSDSDFEFLDKIGQVYKGTVLPASINRTDSIKLGDQNMFDVENPSEKHKYKGGVKAAVDQQTNTSNGYKLSISLLSVISAFTLSTLYL